MCHLTCRIGGGGSYLRSLAAGAAVILCVTGAVGAQSSGQIGSAAPGPRSPELKAEAQRPEIRRNPKDALEYVWIPPGTFTMGCSAGDQECFADEKPAHQVTLTAGFWISQTEVTIAAYKRFAGIAADAKPVAPGEAEPQGDTNSMPVVDVTWDEAVGYCEWAGGRLPTEAEWEYAARAGTTTPRYGELDKIAWYEANSSNTSHAVGEKEANGFGLFDMLGNVWEWVNDWYSENYYSVSPAVDPQGPVSGGMRVLRGGSWLNPENLMRVSDRGRSEADARFNYFSFRCVWQAAAPER